MSLAAQVERRGGLERGALVAAGIENSSWTWGGQVQRESTSQESGCQLRSIFRVLVDRIGREKFDKNIMTESVPNKPDRRRQRSQILGSSNQSGGNKISGGQSTCLLFAWPGCPNRQL